MENLNHKTEQEETQSPSYTPASFEKRVAAWVGIAYMLMLVGLITYTISTARLLLGTFPLLLVPAGIGVPFIVVHRQKQGTAPGGMVGSVLMCILCLVAVILGLILGVPALVSNLVTPM